MAGLGAAKRPDPADLHESLQLGSIREVAAHYGVHHSTIAAWRRRPEYRAFLADLARAARDRIAADAARDYKLIHDTAHEIAEDEGADPHARLNAARLLREQQEALYGENDAASKAEESADGEAAASLAGRVRGLLDRARGKVS